MLLALDVGNTHVVVGLMEGRQVRRSFRIATRRDNAVGDYIEGEERKISVIGKDKTIAEGTVIDAGAIV